MSIHARSMASSYSSGRARIRKLNADMERLQFIERLFDACHDLRIIPTDTEADFIFRVVAETDSKVPVIHDGDANICDSLRRKYESKLA